MNDYELIVRSTESTMKKMEYDKAELIFIKSSSGRIVDLVTCESTSERNWGDHCYCKAINRFLLNERTTAENLRSKDFALNNRSSLCGFYNTESAAIRINASIDALNYILDMIQKNDDLYLNSLCESMHIIPESESNELIRFVETEVAGLRDKVLSLWDEKFKRISPTYPVSQYFLDNGFIKAEEPKIKVSNNIVSLTFPNDFRGDVAFHISADGIIPADEATAEFVNPQEISGNHEDNDDSEY